VELRAAYQLSEERACGLVGITRWINRYRSRRDPQEELRQRLRELAGSRPRFGYRRLTVLLRREGWPVNARRVSRLYRQEELGVRTAKRKWRAAQQRVPLPEPTRPNQHWSMDFVSDRLSAKPHPQFGSPDVNRLWSMVDRAGLHLRCPGLQRPRMFFVSPVDGDQCGKFCRRNSSG